MFFCISFSYLDIIISHSRMYCKHKVLCIMT
nr:MAG TPA: NINTH ZINC-FINGER DOMAIN OF THE-finger, beta-hairpin + alpha-helix, TRANSCRIPTION [Caudoviricetes sp.]